MSSKKDNYNLLIAKLDNFIRKYYTNRLIKGILFTVALVLVLFLVFNFIEYQFYLGKGLRKVMFFGFLLTSIGALLYWVFLPILNYFKLGKVISHERAASIIGNHFGNVEDKLLNILQLKQQSQGADHRELIEASINQKAEKINIVPFKSAIDLNNNRRHLKYALPPLLLLLFILFAAPSIIKDSTYRIINNNVEFERAAPFSFTLVQDELSVLQHQDFVIDVNTGGEALPEDVFIDVESYQYRMTKEEKDRFRYTFKNVQKPIKFNFYSGKVKSKSYELTVMPKPALVDFNLRLDYPAYTGRTDESIANIGDVIVPVGTSIRWDFKTEHTDELELSFNSKKVEAEEVDANTFRHQQRQYRDELYKVFIANTFMPQGDSVSYSINVIPDNHPTISVQTFQDSIENEVVYFVGQASDDYGLSNLKFHYRVTDEKGLEKNKEALPMEIKGKLETPYDYLFDISALDIKPGDQVEYYFEVFDNDGVNGNKSAKTGTMTYRLPTIEEFEELEDENEEEIKNNLEESIEDLKKLRERMKEFKDKMLNEKEMDWQDRKELEQMLEHQKELEKKLEEAKKKFEENQENQEQLEEQNEKLQEKEEKLQEMFEEVMSEEQQELMQKIEELMQELNKDQSIEMMEQMEMSDEQMEMEMERMLELFKQLEVEKEMQDRIEELEELAEKQEELSEDTKNEEKPDEQLKEEQEEINEEFEEIKEKMEELEEKNEELEFPKDLGEENEEDMEDIQEDLDDSEEKLEQNDKKSASGSQKSASEKMKKMAKKMGEQMQSGEQEQLEEDIKAMRQLLENLVTLSFEQEDLVSLLNRTNVTTPRYRDLVQDQFKIKDDFQLVQDSLEALSKRQAAIETFVTEKVTEIKFNFKSSLKNLEEREKPTANQNQRFAMKNMNDLALMLAESMEQMQQQMGEMMSGDQMCNNPGDGKKGDKKGKKGGQGRVPSDKITEGQKQLNEGLQKMAQDLKNGEGKGAKEWAQAAARQAAMRKALEELQQERGEDGQGMSQELQEIIDQMNETETDLVNKQLDSETLMRQQNIETRLLEVEKADRQREFDKKRKGETARQMERKVPPAIEEYIKKREAEVEMYKTISPSLRPYYRQLVEEYYNELKAN